ncbi:MAG: type VI secretion system tip protein TssI/VgrG [Myxococcota bacterium]
MPPGPPHDKAPSPDSAKAKGLEAAKRVSQVAVPVASAVAAGRHTHAATGAAMAGADAVGKGAAAREAAAAAHKAQAIRDAAGRAGAVPTPGALAPEVALPAVPTPGALAPDVAIPTAPTPDPPAVPTPGALAPDVAIPTAPTPETPAVPTPGALAPDVAIPTAPTPGTPAVPAIPAPLGETPATSVLEPVGDERDPIPSVADAAADAVREWATPARIECPEFHFTLTAAPELDWHVRRFNGSHQLSGLYQVGVELETQHCDIELESLLGASCELWVERGELAHPFFGIIDEVDYLGVDSDRLLVFVRVVPAFSMLQRHIDTRFFQGATAKQVLYEVLSTALSEYGREIDVESFLRDDYNPRDYCVQFRESTFDFCSRIMEEEGIAYFFAPDLEGCRETLVLIDNNEDYPPVELVQDDEVPVIAGQPDLADRESLQHLHWRARCHVNKVSVRGYNLKAAKGFDDANDEELDAHNHCTREVFLHGQRRQIVDDPMGDPYASEFTGEGLPQRIPMSARALQRFRAQSQLGRGTSNVTGFAPGRVFTLGMHEREDLDGRSFLLLRVVHRGACDGSAATASYNNRFECIPLDQPYRPPVRIPPARVYGPQLGKVVGPPGSEIHTDPLGRIKVLLHCDRISPTNDTASCWMRVTQSLAGPNWGSVFIPRVGMEVVVQFVDGNPDCPVVTGCVYNSENTPPNTLPDEKTKTTLKTSSSVDSDGYNELTFEDAAGIEQIIVRAQKDFNKEVLNNQTRSVGCNDATSVGGNQTLSVSGDRTHSVTGNETLTIDGSQKVTINGCSTGEGQTVTGGQLDIKGDYQVDSTGNIKVQAPEFILFTVGKSSLKIEPKKITLTAEDGSSVELAPQYAEMKSAQGSRALLNESINAAANKGGDLLLTENAQLTGKQAQVFLNGDALMQSAGNAEVKLDDNALLKGAEATVDGKSAATLKSETTATLSAAGSTVKATSASLDASGKQVNIAGRGSVGVTGGVIRLN